MQKRTRFRSRKILDAAKGEECLINSPVCNYDSSTVVACHSNESDDGKGTGQKADDCFVAFGCSACHTWLDKMDSEYGVSHDEVVWYMNRGIKRTIRRLIDKGVLIVK